MRLAGGLFLLAVAFPISGRAEVTPVASSGDWTTFSDKGTTAGVCGVQANVNGGKFTLWGTTDRQGVLRLSLFKPTWSISDISVPVVLSFSGGATIKLNGAAKDTTIRFDIPGDSVKPLLHYFTAQDQMTVTFPDGRDSPWVLNLKGTTPTVLAIAQCIDAVQLILPPPFRAPQPLNPDSSKPSADFVQPSQTPTAPAVSPIVSPAPAPAPEPTQSSPDTTDTPVPSRAVAAPAAAEPSTSGSQSSGTDATPIVLIVILVLSCIVGFYVYTVNAEKNRKIAQRNRLMDAIKAEISMQGRALRVGKMQKQMKDQYGTLKTEKWVEEMNYFVRTRLNPILFQHGYSEWPDETLQHTIYLVDMTASEVIPDEELLTSEFVSSPENYDPRMHPIDYEIFCATKLQKAGWDTRMTKTTGDQGADIIAQQAGKMLVVQCKLYSSPIGNDAVQQAIAAKTFQSADIAAVVSNQPYTRSAKELASVSRVYLLHHSELVSFRPKEL